MNEQVSAEELKKLGDLYAHMEEGHLDSVLEGIAKARKLKKKLPSSTDQTKQEMSADDSKKKAELRALGRGWRL